MENKNLLNLLKWVLKKGPSETKKYQAWEEKDQVKRTKLVQKRTKLSEKDQVKRTKLGMEGASLRNIFRYVAMIFAVLVMSMANVGMAWGDQTGLISGVTLPDVPSTSLDMSTQTFKTPDANGWIVMQPNADIRNAGVTWFTALAWNTNSQTISDVSSYTAPFFALDNVACTTVRKTGRTKAIRFTGASDISFLVTSGGGSRTIYVSLYTYNTSNGSQALVETKSAGNSFTELLFSGLTTSTTYVAYMYESEDSNGMVCEIALKKPAGGGDTTPPTLSSSTPANAATDVAVSGNITLTFSENVTINDASKFTLSGGAGTLNTASATASGTVVTIPYSGLANNTTYTLATAAEAVKDGSNNKNAALSNISFTTVAAADPLGSHTLTWNLTVRESGSGESTLGTATTDIGTASTASTSTYLTSLTDLTGVGVKRTTDGKSNNTGKIETPSSYDADKYVTMTFAVASGYQFTPSSVSIKTVAVSTTKDLKFEFSDANGSYSVTKTSLSTSGTAATNTLDFSGCDKAFTGTVTVKIYVYGATNQYRLSTPLTIDGTVAAAVAPSCTAPNHVDISGNYHFFPGETLALTATAYSTAGTNDPIAAGDISGYQWQKYIGSDWENIVGETSATYTKANATTSDVGQYRCIVSTGATCSTTSGTFNAKCLQLYVYWDDKSDKCNLPFTKVDGTHATVNVSLENGTYTYYYKVTDGCGNWWGNDGTMTSSNCSGWNLNVNNHCGLTTTKAAAYTFNLTYNAGVDVFSMSVVYPSSVQVGGYNLYFANDERNWSNIHYRIGRSNWNSKAAMTLVPGTANLYQTTTIHYEDDGGFEAWHIANNGGWSNGNSIYKTKTDDSYAITNATRFEGAPVPSTGLTVIPGSDHSTGGDAQNNNCEFYSYTTVPGMLRDRVTITAPVNGTITVNYTSEEGVASSFSATTVDMYQDLAHTVIITPTVTPAEGYTLSGLTVNGAAHTSGNTYTVTANTTIAATFSPASYTVTLNTNGGTINAGNVTSYTYGTGATLPTNVTKDGFTFGGWYDNSGLTGSAVTTISTTATGNKEYWAKWTAAASLTALECNTRYTVQDMTAGGCGTLSGTSCYSAGLSANNRFEVLGDPSLQGNDGGTPEQKTNTAQTINSISFNSFMYLKGDGLNGASEPANPTCRGVKFIIPSAGKLTIYYRYGDRSKLKKEGQTGVNVGATTGGYGYDTHDVTAGTYYIYGASSGAVLIAVEYQCCTTPAAPTAFANTAVTSTTATFSITDAADAASYDLYYASGSPSTPTAGTNATENVTTKTPTITGLTASTTYKIWVRSVCDADHKSAWVALGTTSFTTSAAEPTALVTWQMKVDQAAWALKSGTTEDGTNITSIASTADEPGSTSTGITGTTGKVVMASGESNVDKAASFTFTVNSAKKVVPEKVTCKVLNVSSGNRTYKAQLSDNNGHVYYSTNTVSVTTENVLTDATFNFASSLVLTGNVTLKVYAWKTSGSPTQFRMGEYVKLFGEVQSAADYTVTHTMSNVTKSAGATSVKEGNNYTATYAGAGGYALPSTITVTIGGSPATAGTDYTWTQGTGVVTIPGNKVTGNIVITVTGVAPAPTYSVTHNLSNVTATSGATGAGAATEGVAYDAVFSANTGYVLPSTITVTIGGSPATVGTGYTWNASTGAFQVPAAQVTGAIVVTIAGETAPATKDIYYGAITITAGALTKGSTGTVQFFTNTGGTIANNTEISLSTTLGAGSEYYLSNDLTGAELSKSSNWTTSSSSNRYVQGVKFGSGKSYTLALGSKVASSITFYGINGSASKTMTIGGQAWTSSSTKNTFAKHQFTKSGNFTGNVSITQDGDFYGILVITIQTATPCTTPVIPALSNQTVCPGSDIAAWDATQTAVLADGETASYSWKKKGNDTEIEDEATLDLGAAIESMAGTYVVTVTVSKAGKASSSASKEVTLTVTAAVEEPVITANKATVYPGNSVTLTATCGTDGVTWNWYLCANADGTGAESSLGTSSSYTIASAGAAGTYYYKAVATGSCGTAEAVYTLVVSAASECEKYFWFVYAADATSNGVINNRDNFFGSSPKTGSSNSSSYKFTLDGTEYTATRNTGDNTFSISFTVPEGSTATLALNCKGSSSKPIYLIPTSGDPVLITDNSSNAAHVVENIAAGTYKVGAKTDASASWTLAGMAVQVCTASSCTDATPTITAVNNTVCSGTKMRIDATGYETGATFKWQKLNTSTSSWDDVAEATLDSLVIASVTASNAGSYRFIATKGCARTSNTVTISVPSAPNFGSTVPASVSVMQTIALSINTVEATDAVKYRWYKSADPTWDAGDVEIGTNKELIKAYDGEAIGTPSYYIFCRAQNSCGITTSDPIAVNVTAYVEEDCATRGNEGDAGFGFENTGMSSGTYDSKNVWYKNSNSNYLTYTAPEGKYLATAKVTVASSNSSNASYQYSTDNGANWSSGVTISGLTTSLAEKTINLPANVTDFRIGRNLGGAGESSGTFYLHKACFTYNNACTATTVTVSGTGSESYTIGSGEFTEPTFTLAPAAVSGETLTYSSSNEDIASVDDDGTVTFNGDAGTVTITAAYAGGEVSSTQYCASEGSYTINVSCTGGAPKIVPASSVDLSGCNASVTLNAKKQDGTAFAAGTYQWFRNGEEIDGATSSSYTATQAGTYTVERTNAGGCTTPSTNSAIVTSETTEPEVERLVPFQYYHVDKTYSDQMKMRHLFAVKNSGKLDGKSFKMYVSRSGGAATDVTSSNALEVWPSDDGHVDTVMVDLNKLSGKYSENDELVFTCKAIDCSGNVSDVYKETITMNVIGATPTLALICSGSSKAGGTRKTGELTVGGDFLTGYNVADLCQQTGNTSFDANTEWGLYTDLKTQYIVTPVNGYAVFNKLNYEPFDILLLTDYPKASKSDAAADVLDDMAALCDYRPMLSFKTHMVAKSPSKWAEKGFTTSPVVTKADGRLNLNIVCYAHPMFEGLKSGVDVYEDADSKSAPLVYTMLSGTGYESNKGMQGFELAAAENFVTIGLTHYNATIAKNSPLTGEAEWTPLSEDRMLVTVAERQTNIEARFILFSLNCGAQSKLTDRGEQVVLACLEYLLDDDPLHVADCSFTFDNGASNEHDAAWYSEHCNTCTGTKGDGKWTTAANWGPDYRLLPGEFTSVRIKKPVEVNDEHAHVMEVRIIDEGSIDIPAGKALDVKSTIRRMDGTGIYPTDVNDIHIGSASIGNGTLIFNNDEGDTKARVDMYSTAKADMVNMSAATSTWQYIGTPHNDVQIATYNYYDSWLYQYDTSSESWVVIPNGGPLVPFRGYCVTHPQTNHTFEMYGKLVATTNVDLDIPAGKYVVVANSWVAPIDINAITADDMEGITDQTIYFFNTGSDTEGTGGTGTAAGTYRATPINAASYTGDWQIPSMQGFYVVGGSSDGTLHLDYSRHVRPSDARSVVGNQMYAPRRSAESNEPEVAKLYFRGHRYYDRLIVLEREDFTRGYDSGWDGEAWGGNDAAPMSYVSTEGRWDAVSAVPEYEGTVIGFRAGEDNEYTIDFEYSPESEPLYLLDTENNTYTQVIVGNAYHFTTGDKASHERFVLTRKSPSVTTEIDNVQRDNVPSTKARKILIEDKLFIMINGLLYDATGKVVK